MRTPWFQRDIGSKVHKIFPDCECANTGRPYCFGCLADTGYAEQEPRYNQTTIKPAWWVRRQQTHFTPADLRFLAGLPEIKPFYPRRRKTWQKAY